MIDPMRHAIEKLLEQQDLTAAETHAAVIELMSGQSSEPEIAAFLTALRIKGECVAEIAGAASAMREKSARIPTQISGKLDTCGTGGSGLHTFNISTATAIVAAACGVPVVKHGNRGITSKSGSSDVLSELNVNLNLSAEEVGQVFDRIELCFCFAPIFHAAMKHAAPVRKALGFRTIFNLLGPLTNPAGAEFQLLGTARNEFARKLSHALHELGSQSATVVCGNNELDEVSLWGETLACRVSTEGVVEEVWTADDFGLPECTVDELRIDSSAQSAELIEAIFAGTEQGPACHMVLANTAAALLTVGKTSRLEEGVAIAREAIDSGLAAQKLEQLVETGWDVGD